MVESFGMRVESIWVWRGNGARSVDCGRAVVDRLPGSSDVMARHTSVELMTVQSISSYLRVHNATECPVCRKQ